MKYFRTGEKKSFNFSFAKYTYSNTGGTEKEVAHG